MVGGGWFLTGFQFEPFLKKPSVSRILFRTVPDFLQQELKDPLKVLDVTFYLGVYSRHSLFVTFSVSVLISVNGL